MSTKTKEILRNAFISRMMDHVVMVNENGTRIPLDDYMEQESYRRPYVVVPEEVATKEEIIPEGGHDQGILSPEAIAETNYYLMKAGILTGRK